MDLQKLDKDDIAAALAGMQSGWADEGGAISKTFTFDSFFDAADFVAALGDLSDDLEGHHPDEVLIRGQVVRLRLFTPAIQGVSDADVDLAELADDIVEGALAHKVASRFLGDAGTEG